MAISNAYPKGAPVEDFDLFVGTKAFSNRTVNYTSQGIADYLNINAKVSIGGQLSFKFTIVPNVPKTIAFDGGLGDGTAFSAINELIVSAIDVSSNNITIFLNYLNNSKILLSQQNQPNFFGHYKITGYTQIGLTDFYKLDLEFIGGNGTIGDEQYYDLVSFVLTSAEPVVTPNLQEVTEVGNETTEDVIFRLNADKYIKVDNSAQRVELWDEIIDDTIPITHWDKDSIYFKDATGNQISISAGYTNNLFADGSTFEMYGSNIILTNAGLFLNLTNELMQFGNGGGDLATYTLDKIVLNTGEYLLPTGPSSQIATLLDIPTKTSELTNDGQDGVHPFLSVLDLPSNLILFPTTTSADVSGYFKLVTSLDDPDYDEPAVDVSTGAITTTGQLIASLVTVPNLINGNPGVFNVSTYGNIRRTSGSGTAEFYFEIYQRNAAGTETLIGTSGTTAPVNTGVYTQFSESALWDNGVFLDTDRIVLKFYANRISGASDPTYDFQFGGDEPVRTLVPIPLSVLPSQIPTLQQVTDEGATTTNAIETGNIVATDVNGGDAPFVGKYDSVDGVGKIIMQDTSTNNFHELRFNAPTSAIREIAFKDESGTVALISDVDLKLNIEAAATTGVVISFTNDRVYGTIASPETGNITADVTGGLLGVTNIIIHNSGSAPTFGAQFKKLSGSGNYVTSVVNYIYCTYITSTEIIYSINQRT